MLNLTGNSKPILAILDAAPVLDPELLKLSKWLADTTFAFWITCVQTMLPAQLKAAADKWVHPLTPAGQALIPSAQALDDLPEAALAPVLKAVQHGDLEVEYRLHDRAKVKTVAHIVPDKSAAEYAEIANWLEWQRQTTSALIRLVDPVANQRPDPCDSRREK
jgi:primosomal protein N' (replication factor Y)